MKPLKKMIPYLIAVVLVFYLLPFLIKDTGSGMTILLIVIPASCFLISLIYGLKNSFHWLFLLLIMLLFAPTIFLFYNESAAIYILIYGILSLVGNLIGSAIRKTTDR
ncbi:MAG: hypothetical protein Q4A52_02785 [Bacillota bacterium]|nr:hypothetical protein [Bacillota bacterium]